MNGARCVCFCNSFCVVVVGGVTAGAALCFVTTQHFEWDVLCNIQQPVKRMKRLEVQTAVIRASRSPHLAGVDEAPLMLPLTETR